MNGGMQNQMTGISSMMPSPQQMQQPQLIPQVIPPAPQTQSTQQERPRSGSNPFDQFNPFDTASTSSTTTEQEPAKRRPSNNPFDSM